MIDFMPKLLFLSSLDPVYPDPNSRQRISDMRFERYDLITSPGLDSEA